MSDSKRPIDSLVASLLATKSADSTDEAETLGEGVGHEELDRVQRAVEAMARTAEVASSLEGPSSTPGRLDRFGVSLARFFDFSEADALQLLARIDRAEEWMEGPDAGISLLPVEAGPSVRNALASLVRLPPGVTLGDHEHVGREQLFVLEGAFADSVGHAVSAGETLEMGLGTRHSMWGLPGPACICAALLFVDSAEG